MKSQKGVTLVELLVAGIIAVVIGGVVIIMFLMYTRETQESAAFTRMQIQYDNLIEQIARDVRRADRVLLQGETYTTIPPVLDSANSHRIDLYDASGVWFKSYSVASDLVSEIDTSATTPFNVGNDNVTVSSTESKFVLHPQRIAVNVSLTLKTTARTVTGTDTTYYLSPRRDMMVCRRNY